MARVSSLEKQLHIKSNSLDILSRRAGVVLDISWKDWIVGWLSSVEFEDEEDETQCYQLLLDLDKEGREVADSLNVFCVNVWTDDGIKTLMGVHTDKACNAPVDIVEHLQGKNPRIVRALCIERGQ